MHYFHFRTKPVINQASQFVSKLAGLASLALAVRRYVNLAEIVQRNSQ